VTDARNDTAHGLVDPSIKRSREGVRVVLVWLALLGATAAIQAAIYIVTGSVGADPLIGLAITALILGITSESWLTVRGRAHAHHH
jgi:hypothetical protein